jgi:hypothetical protein
LETPLDRQPRAHAHRPHPLQVSKP